jgi:hypothetical protein
MKVFLLAGKIGDSCYSRPRGVPQATLTAENVTKGHPVLSNRKCRRHPAIGILNLVLLFVPLISYAQSAPKSKSNLRDSMDKLWEHHVTWTRLYIVSAAANLPDNDSTAQRLLQSQSDIGDAIKLLYGDATGDKLAGLLKDHIMISTEIIDAAKAGEAANRWNANADDIAVMLSAANPKNWPIAERKKMMREHLDLTTAEVVARLQGDWAADIAAYEKVHTQIRKMAEMLSTGIIKQFPNKFK